MSRPKHRGTTTRRKSDGRPPRHQGVIRTHSKTGYVLGDLCKVCGEPLYTAIDDPTRKWCTDPTCRSHRR